MKTFKCSFPIDFTFSMSIRRLERPTQPETIFFWRGFPCCHNISIVLVCFYSTPINLQITPTLVSIGAESQFFHLWMSEKLHFRNLRVFYFIYEKIFFMKMLILLKQDLYLIIVIINIIITVFNIMIFIWIALFSIKSTSIFKNKNLNPKLMYVQLIVN